MSKICVAASRIVFSAIMSKVFSFRLRLAIKPARADSAMACSEFSRICAPLYQVSVAVGIAITQNRINAN
ncbi:hypothetical protein D3C87_1727760 [compost metagenome]